MPSDPCPVCGHRDYEPACPFTLYHDTQAPLTQSLPSTSATPEAHQRIARRFDALVDELCLTLESGPSRDAMLQHLSDALQAAHAAPLRFKRKETQGG